MNDVPDDFDWKNYVDLYEDLREMNELEAKNHYLMYGYKENRKYKMKLPEDFDWKTYVDLNFDLSGMTDLEAKTHYLMYGYKENRKYKMKLPEDFDWKTYVELNEDLKDMTEEEAINHYINHGVNENRIYFKFDWELYLKLNVDLYTNGINTKQDAYRHWINHGYKEGRQLSVNEYIRSINSHEHKILNILFKKFIIGYNNKIIHVIRNIYPIYYNNNEKKNFIISFENVKIINKIPKKIHKIFLNDGKEHINVEICENALSTWAKYYPDYELIIYDKNDAINYLNKYYGKEFVYIYNLLIPFAYKCDFLRLCILYEEGGIYSDIKQSIHKKLDIDFDKYNFVYSEEKHMDWTGYLKINYSSIQNCFIAVVPKHPYIKCAIDLIIQNVLNRYYCLCDIDITGPIVFGCAINQVKLNWSFLDESLEKKLYFNRYKTETLTTYVISEHNMVEINSDYDYLIKHKYDDDNSTNNWNYSNKQKTNAQTYSTAWKYNEVFVPYIREDEMEINTSVASKVVPYKKYNHQKNKTYINLEDFTIINSFILILDTTNEENIYMNDFINMYSYCKTFITIKIINDKPIILCNNNTLINNISSLDDIYIFLNMFFHKTSNIILWNDIPTNIIINDTFQNMINYINYNKELNGYSFTIYESFYLYNQCAQKRIILINDKLAENLSDKSFVYDIQPFMIYFPQFHHLKENDLNFYEGFTDSKNLQKLVDSNRVFPLYHKIITPLQCNNISDYDLTNVKIIEEQISILEKYNIPGLAMYYYWFSNNSVTKNNMVMKDVIDIFFKINLKNRKIFFIWANECWTKSQALSGKNIKHSIENTYDRDNLEKNINNLISYFTNDNYLKLNNKPVFFIHHPWMIPDEDLKNLYKIFNETCILNNFDGIEIVVNSMFKNYPECRQYSHNLNYKWCNTKNYECKYYDETYNNFVVDYDEYIKKELGHVKDNEINVYFTDFDNSARLIEPNKLNLSTYIVNNNDLNKQLFLNNIVSTYKNKIDKTDKILLINGFNEWGEQMAFEPSKEYGYYNLNLLSDYLEIKKDNIIILTGGKTGGSTLTSTLNELNAIHIHSNEHFKRWKQTKYSNVYDYINYQKSSYIITVHRPIFERKISGLFQALSEPNDYNKIFNIPKIENISLDNLLSFFKNHLLDADFENYDPIEELLNYYNKDIPKNFFNFEKKYGIIKISENINILVLRFKDIKCWDKILSQVFNKQITLHSVNNTNDKKISNMYEQFKLLIKERDVFSDYYIKEYNSIFFSECYNTSDCVELKKNWCNSL